MKRSERLLDAIGQIDDGLVEAAAKAGKAVGVPAKTTGRRKGKKGRRKNSGRPRILLWQGALAACAGLAVCVGLIGLLNRNGLLLWPGSDDTAKSEMTARDSAALAGEADSPIPAQQEDSGAPAALAEEAAQDAETVQAKESGEQVVSIQQEPDTKVIFGDPGQKDAIAKTADDSGSAQKEAYKAALNSILLEHRLPGGEDWGDEEGSQFAVFDVDGDGRDELIVAYQGVIMAGMHTDVYGYDETSGTLREELTEFPSLTFYDNGRIEAGASHNHGRGPTVEDFWPYTLYEYDSAADQYREVCSVDVWDKAYRETDNEGGAFPDEQDLDGDGILYYTWGGSTEAETFFDREAYFRWRDSLLGGAGQMEIPFLDLTVENIENGF